MKKLALRYIWRIFLAVTLVFIGAYSMWTSANLPLNSFWGFPLMMGGFLLIPTGIASYVWFKDKLRKERNSSQKPEQKT